VTVDDPNSNVTSYDGVFFETPISVGGLIIAGFYSTVANTIGSYNIQSRNLVNQPVPATTTVSNGGAVPLFTSSIGSPEITVTFSNISLPVGANLPILVPVVFAGLTLYGNYVIKTIIDANNFTITADSAATATVANFAMNGGRARIKYFIGAQSTAISSGFGSGGFGVGGFGTGTVYDSGRILTTTAAATVGTNPPIATVTFSTATSGSIIVPKGSVITVAGVVPSGYNGVGLVTTADGNGSNVVYEVGAPALGPQTTPGTIAVTKWGFEPVESWSLDNWGEDLIANDKGGNIWYWEPRSGSDHAVIVPFAPQINEGCFVAMPQRQIIAYGSTFSDIQDPMLVRWSDIGNFSTWIGNVVNQAGSYRVPKGSKIVGGIQGPRQCMLWTDLGVWAVQYINLPYIYSFNEIASGCGLAGQKAAIAMSGVVYWMSQTQFFAYAGSGVSPIPCPIWDIVFQQIDFNYSENIRCAANSRFNEVTWYYPVIGSGGVPTNYAKFNTVLGQWDYGVLTRTAWIDQNVFGSPIGAGQNTYIYQHEISNNDDGAPMTSGFRTGFFAMDEGDIKNFVDQIWPDMKWGFAGGSQNAEIQIKFYVCDYPGQVPVVHGPFSFTEGTEYITPRLRGRLISIEIYSEDLNSFWRLGNIRYRFQPDGKY
jgi:hypothetical protein